MSTKFRIFATLGLLLAQYLALGVLSAEAITYYVRKTGNDGSSGTSSASAFLTIGAAASRMVAGDAVWIGAGTYSEQVTCANSGNAASVISYLGDITGAQTGDTGSVIISNGGIPFNGNGHSYININGISTSGGNPGMSFVGGSNIALQYCDISGANNGMIIDHATLTMSNCASHNNSGQGAYVVGGANVSATACNFYSNTAYGIYVGPSGSPSVTVDRTLMNSNTSGGISVTNGNVVASNCIIYDSWDGVDIWDGYAGYAGGSLTLDNCVVADSHDDGTWINKGTFTMMNTIVAFNHSWGINVAGGTCNHTFNAFWSDGYGLYNATVGNTGEILADPSFVNEPAHDFHLNDASPCIDVGTTISSVLVDYSNKARPHGASYDIGPYEAGATTTSSGVRIKKWVEIQ